MDPDVQASLLASIETGRLVLMCGAGLSMAPPSSVPSARDIAIAWFDDYRIACDPECNPALRENLEALAEHFASLGMLNSAFIEKFIPWMKFVRPPNSGHAAVADFLIIRAFFGALSTNFDFLIERRAESYGADFYASLDGDEATVRAAVHSPLLKVHGCAQRDRGSTLWTKAQLSDPLVAGRIQKSRMWMAANLREKDLLVVGFWSDWDYLNAVLGEALEDVSPLSVMIVDLATSDVLEAKAPGLWALAHKPRVMFQHVQTSGADFLDDLRRAFSKAYLRKVLSAGVAELEATTGVPCDPEWLVPPDVDSRELYALRRDAEGVPSTRPAKRKEPAYSPVLGFFHLLLRQSGATFIEGTYRLSDRAIRVINGAGEFLSVVRARFTEPPAVVTADVIVCVGATDLGGPDNVVRTGRPGDVVRPAAAGEWVDMSRGRELLNI